MKREFLEKLLKDNGVEDSKELIDSIMTENGNDIEAAKKEVSAIEADRDKYKEQLDTATANLEKFKDVKPEELQATIEKLQGDLKAKDDEYTKKEAERAFTDSIKEAVKAAGAKNEKAVMALLDLDVLRESKNQKEDIGTAIEAAKKDNDYMFTSKEPINNPTGPTGGGGGGDSTTATLRAVMGLPEGDK